MHAEADFLSSIGSYAADLGAKKSNRRAMIIGMALNLILMRDIEG